MILFQKPGFELPSELIELISLGTPLSIGNEVSWLGFPAIEPYTLCFFSGNISAWQDFRKAYLIDGVAINGVSGGPVTYLHSTDGVKVVGIVSAYRANRAAGDTLPGLLYAQDVSHFHGVINQVRSFAGCPRIGILADFRVINPLISIPKFSDFAFSDNLFDEANKKKQEIEQQQQTEKGIAQQGVPADADKAPPR